MSAEAKGKGPEDARKDKDNQNSSHATSQALKNLTLAISNAVFNKDFDSPLFRDNLSARFHHRCDSRRPVTHTLEAYLESLREWPIEFPHWAGTVLDVSLLEMDAKQGYAEIMVLQQVRGLQGPGSSLECSTVWEWKRTTVHPAAGGRWLATASYSGHHPLPDDFDFHPTSAAMESGLVAVTES